MADRSPRPRRPRTLRWACQRSIASCARSRTRTFRPNCFLLRSATTQTSISPARSTCGEPAHRRAGAVGGQAAPADAAAEAASDDLGAPRIGVAVAVRGDRDRLFAYE